MVKLQTLLVILSIIVAVLNILDKILGYIGKFESRAKRKAHCRKPGKHKRK